MLIEKYNQLLKELQECSQVKIIEKDLRFHKTNLVDLNASNENLKSKVGFSLPDELLELFYFKPKQNTRFSWHKKLDKEYKISGCSSIERIDATFNSSRNKFIQYNMDVPVEMIQAAQNAHYFDYNMQLDGSAAGLLVYSKDMSFPEVWFNDRHELFKMNLTLKEYFDALQLLKGACYWQYLYTDINVREKADSYKIDYIRRTLPFLQEHFPNHDYTDPLKCLEEI